MKKRKNLTARRRIQIDLSAGQMTKQSHRDECDINQIMAKFQNSGMVDHFNNHQAQYGFASGDSFYESMLVINKAQSMFDELPSSVRKRFANSPSEFLEFVQNPDNADDLVKLGLSTAPALPQKSPAPIPVPTDNTSDPE